MGEVQWYAVVVASCADCGPMLRVSALFPTLEAAQEAARRQDERAGIPPSCARWFAAPVGGDAVADIESGGGYFGGIPAAEKR